MFDPRNDDPADAPPTYDERDLEDIEEAEKEAVGWERSMRTPELWANVSFHNYPDRRCGVWSPYCPHKPACKKPA